MSQECICETPTMEVPVLGIKLSLPENFFPAPGPSESGIKTWESDWFKIAENRAYNFQHNLNFTKPWLIMPRLVFRVIKAEGGWEIGDIIFADGQNYVGATGSSEMGWAISATATEAQVTFGNHNLLFGTKKSGGFGTLYKSSVEANLVITY